MRVTEHLARENNIIAVVDKVSGPRKLYNCLKKKKLIILINATKVSSRLH